MGTRLAKDVIDGMEAMRMEGHTYEEIGNAFGVSKQRVYAIIGGKTTYRFQPYKKDRCIYAGLREWLNKNYCSVSKLTRKLYGNSYPKNCLVVRERLLGKVELSKTQIDLILEFTGLTYEEAFKED